MPGIQYDLTLLVVVYAGARFIMHSSRGTLPGRENEPGLSKCPYEVLPCYPLYVVAVSSLVTVVTVQRLLLYAISYEA